MDRDTISRLYETYYMHVYSFLLTKCRDKNLAEELTQETFVKAFASESDYRGEAKEQSWLCAIAKNLLYDWSRKNARFSEMPEDVQSDENIEKELVREDSAFRIHLALHALEEPYREVFELRVFGELSFQKIGAIFGKTETWARVTFHRAKGKLTERMRENDTEL